MLQFGQILQQNCQGLSRREMLRIGSIGALGLQLPDLLRVQAAGNDGSRPARAMILLWLWGGPSQIDTFDLKPQAPIEYRGPYSPIHTNVPGIEISELLPRLAQRADRYTIVRSLQHGTNDHGIGGTVGLTSAQTGGTSLGGQTVPGRLEPTHGAIVARLRGDQSELPPFVSIGGRLHQGRRPITGEGGGSLGSVYDPFRLDYDPEEGVKIPLLEIQQGLTGDVIGNRRRLLGEIDRTARRFDDSRTMQRLDEFYQQAYSLLLTPAARRFFDVAEESDAVRRAYGSFRFGQCCLMARRLVEAAVPFVQVNWSSHVEPVEDGGDGGWDMHDRNFSILQDRHSWMLDQSVSALLDDLQTRGLLDSTLVVAVGEFGRTPRINPKAGRDHWEKCYSALVAGGGLRTGQVIGSSDPLGNYPASRPVTPGDLAVTLYDRLGIGTTQLTQIGLTPLGQVIEELL